jgi:hypothetical protein
MAMGVDGGVELSVADAAEAMPFAVAGPDRQGRCAVVSGVGVMGAESAHACCFAEDLGCGEYTATGDGQQARCQLLDQLRDLGLQGEDLLGEFAAALQQAAA